MKLANIHVSSFRLLQDVDIELEDISTVVVGRNNSGKTSLAELFRIVSSDSVTFRLEDFSAPAQRAFWEVFEEWRTEGDTDLRGKLPSIEIELTIEYDPNSEDLSLLSDFVIDLNPDCFETKVLLRHELREGAIDELFDDLPIDSDGERPSVEFYRELRSRVAKYYKMSVKAVDPNDAENRADVDLKAFRSLVCPKFISAQRDLGEITDKERNVLGATLERLFTTALESEGTDQQATAERMKEAVAEIQDDIHKRFNTELDQLMPTFKMFGYPRLEDPKLMTETILDAERLMKGGYTKVRHEGTNGVRMPESYSGLGFRNLIYILLNLFEYFREYQASVPTPGLNVIFIEEPEAHLHPQMQEVFVGQIENVVGVFAREFKVRWQVQFILTTHSSHVANRTDFQKIRYFLTRIDHGDASTRHTTVKNLREGIGRASPGDEDFLHKYLTLTRCDLFFADKAVLVEGASERLLLPRMIQEVDSEVAEGDQGLSSQYISVMEVGGAYAYLFLDLLEFLELPTLIITDIDSVKEDGKSGQRTKCLVTQGMYTSNTTLKRWFDDNDVSVETLLAADNDEKCRSVRRLTYQVPEEEGGPCGRSFEEAFILANPSFFGLEAVSLEEQEAESSRIAEAEKKTDMALRFAIEKEGWAVPKYISEGLEWLAQDMADLRGKDQDDE